MGPAIQALTGAPYYDTFNNEMGVDELWDTINRKLS